MTARILICDDEQDILDITKLILESEGYHIIPQLNSLKVEDMVANEKPDMLLLDLWMPGLAGDQLVKKLRENKAFSKIPIIIISASRDGREIAFASGADDFLEKPYDIDALVGIVNKHLPKSLKIAS